VGNNAALEKAIAVVERTRNHTIGVQVLDYVNEEKDGSAKDEFRLAREWLFIHLIFVA
jgi:WD repeat-containing protein 19